MDSQTARVRRSRHRQEARRAILEATEALLLERGERELSIRRLAARCGYSAPTIYHYFGDKDGLIDALLELRFRQLVRRVKRVRGGEDAVDELRQLTHAYLEFGLQNPSFYRLLTAAPRRSVPAAEEARELWQAPLLRLAAQDRLRIRDIETARQAAWAMLHGLVVLQIQRPEDPWAPDLNTEAVELLLRGAIRSAGPKEGEGCA